MTWLTKENLMIKLITNRLLFIVIMIFSFGMSGCFEQEQHGINLAIRNFTSHEYVLNVAIHDQLGYALSNLSIPIEEAEGKMPFTYYHEINCEFDNLVVKTRLEAVPNSELIDKKVGFWPGEAGSADGASSNRIIVQIGIIESEGQIQANFMGIL